MYHQEFLALLMFHLQALWMVNNIFHFPFIWMHSSIAEIKYLIMYLPPEHHKWVVRWSMIIQILHWIRYFLSINTWMHVNRAGASTANGKWNNALWLELLAHLFESGDCFLECLQGLKFSEILMAWNTAQSLHLESETLIGAVSLLGKSTFKMRLGC